MLMTAGGGGQREETLYKEWWLGDQVRLDYHGTQTTKCTVRIWALNDANLIQWGRAGDPPSEISQGQKKKKKTGPRGSEIQENIL